MVYSDKHELGLILYEYDQDSKISTKIVGHNWGTGTLISLIILLFSMSYICKLELQMLTLKVRKGKM